MASARINLQQLIANIAQHGAALPPESSSPPEHYKRSANDAWNLLRYFQRTAQRTNIYAQPFERHAGRLRSLVLFTLIEAFERYLKEAAACCVDHVAPLVLDDRVKVFNVDSRRVAANFTESLGKALCEGDTWLDCKDINDRFGKLLANPFSAPSFQLFVQASAPDGWRRTTMETLFQLRHTIAHNVSVITRSDAAKLRLLTKSAVDAPRVLSPTEQDVRYSKQFLDETVAWANVRIAERLAEVLTTIHADNRTVFDPGSKADAIAKQFTVAVTVAGAIGTS